MANTSDKITDTRNAARPNSARVITARSSAATSLACDSLTGWPTASKVHFVTYQIDTNSNPIGGTQLDCSGIVSGSTITQLSVLDGTDSGNAIGDVVEMLPTASWGQDLSDWGMVGHTRSGAHAANLPLTTPILTTPVIADLTSATHTHANNAGGGQLTGAAIATGSQLADRLLNPYKFSVYMTTAQTIGAGSTSKVTFDTRAFDTSSNFDTTNKRFVAPIAGFYQFNTNVYMAVGSADTVGTQLYKNGSPIGPASQMVPGGATFTASTGTSALLQLAATDYIEVFQINGSAAGKAISTGSGGSQFSGFLVSAT